MRITLKYESGDTKEVWGHRVLKNTFPELELYVHRNWIHGKKKDGFAISTRDGIGGLAFGYTCVYDTVVAVRTRIEARGVKYCKKGEKRAIRRWKRYANSRGTQYNT